MKVNKLFFGAMFVAALAMVGCKDNKKEPTDPTQPTTPTQDEEEAPEIPAVDAPAAGKTTIAFYAEELPNGAYLCGSHNGYDINDDAIEAVPVPNEEHWYTLTVDYAADLQEKVIARPQVKGHPEAEVPFGWSYQWGKCYDETDAKCDVEEGHDNTIILSGDGEWAFENGGEVKITNLTDGGVVYVWVKNWKSSPLVEPEKAQTAWAKTSWDGAEWTWREMTKVSDGVFEIEGVWGGDGFNISLTEGGAETWYPTDHADFTVEEGAKKGDKIKLTFTSEFGIIGALSLVVVEKGEAIPDVPAGNGTFVVTITNKTYADGDKCIFTGNFEEKSWADSDREMTYDATTQTWSWTGDYPVNFEYKVIYNGAWATGNNVAFDGETFTADFEIQ